MRNVLFVFLLLNISLVANTPTNADFKDGRLVNGNGEGSNLRTEISLVFDINSTNVAQFNKVGSSLTSIDKNNHSYLISKFTYKDEHPIRAKLTTKHLILVFNLSDTNETSPNSKELTIGDHVVRDGATGGATNSGLSAISIDDKASPVLLSAETVDYDTDGHIDNIRLQFTENVYASPNNNGFSVSSHTILGISADAGIGERNDSVSLKTIYLRLKESTSYDTGIQPSISYSGTSINKLGDGSGLDNNITTISSFSVKDEVQPQLLSGYAKSVHSGADIINIGFSEPISPIKPGTGGDILGVGGVGLDGALITYSNGDRNISIELNESKDQGYIPDESISVNILTTAKDKNGKYFTRYILAPEIPVVLEKIKPKLLSISRSGDKGHFIASFDEPIIVLDEDDVQIKYNKNITNNIPYIIDATQNKNKKLVTVKVANMPVFTETETRILTFVMTSEVKDLAGNSIDGNESNKSFTITKDDTPPNAKDFTVNMNDKKIIIDFNDSKVAISSFNPESIVISRFNGGNISLTSKSKAIYDNDFTSNVGKITITLNDDIDSLKSFLKDKEDFNISIFSGSGIVDFAGNACQTKNIPLSLNSNAFISDSVSPNLISWDFDLDNKKMVLNFDEPMKIDDYNASDINISDSNITFLKKLTLSENNSSAEVSNKSIEITLFSSQIIKIINTDLAKDIKRTFIEIIANSNIKDIKGNSVNSLSNGSALRAKIYKVDKNNISKLILIPNKWNHVSINKPTKSSDIMASGKINHIYTYDAEVWNASAQNIDPKIGYWIKAGDHNSNTLEIPSNSKTYLKGTKEDDLARIRSKINGVFHLIGVENNITYEEMHSSKNSICKTMRIHHYYSASLSSSSGWDRNSSVLENSSLWVQCVK